MYCKNCGAQIDDQAVVCPYCGVPTGVGQPAAPQQAPQQNPYATAPVSADAPSMGFAVLCALIPLLGLILFLVWKDQYPLKAKSCGKGAIVGVCIEVVLYIILFVILISTNVALNALAASLTAALPMF